MLWRYHFIFMSGRLSVFYLTPMPFRHPRTMKLIEPRRRHGRKTFELFFAIMASLRFRSFYLVFAVYRTSRLFALVRIIALAENLRLESKQLRIRFPPGRIRQAGFATNLREQLIHFPALLRSHLG